MDALLLLTIVFGLALLGCGIILIGRIQRVSKLEAMLDEAGNEVPDYQNEDQNDQVGNEPEELGERILDRLLEFHSKHVFLPLLFATKFAGTSRTAKYASRSRDFT